MTKAFEFPLERVLNVRQIIEETRSVKLRKSEVELEQEKQQLKELKSQRENQIQVGRRNSNPGDGLTLNNLMVSRNYLVQLNDHIDGQKKNVAKSSAVVKNDRDEVIQATREKQVVEKLRENHLVDYRQSVRREEEKQESEVALRIAVNQDNGVNK